MAEFKTATNTWPELAIGLYEQLASKNAEITYDFDHLEVEVPSSTSADATHATWKLDGVVKIRTKEAGVT